MSRHGDRRDLRRPMNQQNTLGSALEAFIRKHEDRGELDTVWPEFR